MNVAVGLKAHSGWAALVVLGERDDDLVVVDRRRLELAEEPWARQPYHAAEHREPDAARELVARGVESAHRIAIRELRSVVTRESERGNAVAACAVLVVDPMPGWSVHEILAVHFRMHKAEGVLFRDALVEAARACGLSLFAIHEKQLAKHAEATLGSDVTTTIAALGKAVGPPWGKDQKDSALAALLALRTRVRAQ